MKIGVIGAGAVGSACTFGLIMRGTAREIVLVDRTGKRAKAVATDMRYGVPLSPVTDIRDGNFDDLAGAAVIMITAGINEKTGGATDRTDPAGRLRLLDENVSIYEAIVPRIVRAAPGAVLLVVSDPPDPLADHARRLAGHDRVVGAGTYLDSLRFRIHLARELGVSPASVDAEVIGEHGTSEVFLWSSARIAGVPVLQEIERRGQPPEAFRKRIEGDVRYANISIIEGNNASQYGIGMAAARLAEIIVRDERVLVPVASFHAAYGVTFSLPSVLGRDGVIDVIEPAMSDDERGALRRSAAAIKQAEAQAA
jgi:L-lactate dehydrogenase